MADYQRARWSRTWTTTDGSLTWTDDDGFAESTPWADIASVRAGTDRVVIRPRVDGPRLVLPQAQDEPPSTFVADLLRLLPRRLIDEDVRAILDVRMVTTGAHERAREAACPACGGPWATSRGDLVGRSGAIAVELVDEPHRRCSRCEVIAPIDAEQVGEIVNAFLADDALGYPIEQWVAGIEVTAEAFLTGRVTSRYRARISTADGKDLVPPTFGDLAGAVLDGFGPAAPADPPFG